MVSSTTALGQGDYNHVTLSSQASTSSPHNTVHEIQLEDVSSQTPHHAQIVKIEPAQGWAALKLEELWAYRELFYFLTWRDVKIRYKQTALGAVWAIVQPVMTMIVFSIFFGRLAGIPSDGVPYPIFSFAALVPWSFFAFGLTQSSQSLVQSSNLIKKVYFPRLIIPVSSVLAGSVDFALSFMTLVILMLAYGIVPSWHTLWVLPLILLAFVTSLGVGLWLSALNVYYRDVRYIIPFLTQFWFFATPVTYSSHMLSEPWKTIYSLNPMVGVVEGFRWALLHTKTQPGWMVGVSALTSLFVLISGAFYFRRMEKTFADKV